MAYQNVFYIYNVPVTCTESGDHSWLTADFMIKAYANASNTAYNVEVYARMDSSGEMNWNGDGDIRVTCNGKTASSQVSLAMYSPGSTDWDGPAKFEFGAPGEVKLTMNIDLDLTRTTGFSGRPGIDHNKDGGSMRHFYYNNFNITIGEDGGLPPLIVPAVISELTSTNQYNNTTGISASTDSISIKWTESGIVDNRYYRVDGGSWVSVTSPSATISNRTPGTSYKIEVKSSNSAGDSNILSTTIRTRHNTPVVTLTLDSKKIDSLVFKWTSDKALESTQYKLDSGNWVSSGSGTSGTFTIGQLTPNTSYTVYFKGVSTSTYDSLNSNEPSVSDKTLDMARIIGIGDCIFGENITIDISKVVDNTAKLTISTLGNSLSPGFTIDVVNGTNVFTPAQSQLDQMYKCFSNSNSIPLYFTLTTVGQWKEWTDDEEQKSLELTGIAKTVHVGVSDTVKRAQAFMGVSDTPRRAIAWIGDENNKPRRCI